MKFEFYVALRYLKAKRKQTIVSVISAVSILGIATGVMALVIALALSTGFREDIQRKIVGTTAHIELMQANNLPLRNYEPLLEKLSQVPHVIGASPAIVGEVLISSSWRNQGALVKGIDPRIESQVSDFFLHIIEGDPEALQMKNKSPNLEEGLAPYPMIIGKEMARSLGAKVGDRMQILFPHGRLTPLGMIPIQKTFRLEAIFELGLWDYDANMVYTDIDSARRLLGYPPNTASALQFWTDDLEGAEKIAQVIAAKAGTDTTIKTWMGTNRPLFTALQLQKLALFLTISLIIFVAALNIASTLIMMVLDKQQDIAVLVAMGAKPRTIQQVFMLQGLVVGIIGTIMGAITGVALCWLLDTYRLIPLAPEIYSIPYVPFHVHIWDVILVAGTALLISFLATIYPSRNAARLDPVEVMRYE